MFSLLASFIPTISSIPLYDQSDDTSSLVGPAMNGILDWFKDALDISSFIQTFLPSFDFSKDNLNTFMGSFSFMNDLHMVIIYIAGIIMFSLFGLHIVLVNLNHASDSSQKQTLVDLIVRLPVTIALILFIRDIFGILDDLMDDILSRSFFDYSLTDGIADSVADSSVGEWFGSGLSVVVETVTVLPMVIVIVLWICIIMEFFKLAVEIWERNIVLWVLDIFAPLGASAYISRTTNAIFVNYLRMYASQLILAIINKIFFVFLCYSLGHTTEFFDIGFLVLILALLKTAQRIDSHLKTLGLTVAQTGGTLMDSIGMGIAGISQLIHTGGTGGSALSALGAATGNLGLATVGSSLQSLSRGDISGMGDQMGLAKFQSHGGFKNTGLADSATLSRAIGEAKNGNLVPISQLKPTVRTDALKQAFGDTGINSIKEQTGLDLNNAKNLSVNPSTGEVSGIVPVESIDGQEKNVAFKTSATPLNASSKEIHGITGDCYITPMSDGLETGFTTDNTKLMSTLTGTSLNDAIANSGDSGLHISSNEYQSVDGHGYINHYNDTGELVAMTDGKTGEFYSMGTDYSSGNTDTFVTQNDIAALDESGDVTNRISDDGLLGGYDFGSNARIVSGSFQENLTDGHRTAVCQVESNAGQYRVVMSAPSEETSTLMTKRRNVYVGNLGEARGNVVVKVQKMNDRQNRG